MLPSLIVLSVSLATARPVCAEDPQETPPPPEYDVELIIFEYVGGAVGAREDWRYIDTGRAAIEAAMTPAPGMGALSFSDDEPGGDGTTGDADDTDMPAANAEPMPLVFTPLTAGQLRMADTAQRLANSRDYKPLLHVGWRQTVYGPADVTTLDLAQLPGARPAARLEAAASLYVSRFLHLRLDLALAKPTGASFDASGLDTLVYRLDERRKMRSGELHFFDHPRFGALALISKPQPASDASQPASDTPTEPGAP